MFALFDVFYILYKTTILILIHHQFMLQFVSFVSQYQFWWLYSSPVPVLHFIHTSIFKKLQICEFSGIRAEFVPSESMCECFFLSQTCCMLLPIHVKHFYMHFVIPVSVHLFLPECFAAAVSFK